VDVPEPGWTDEGFPVADAPREPDSISDPPVSLPIGLAGEGARPLADGELLVEADRDAAGRRAHGPLPAPAVTPVTAAELGLLERRRGYFRNVWTALWWPLWMLPKFAIVALVAIIVATFSVVVVGLLPLALALGGPLVQPFYLVLLTYPAGVVLSGMRSVIGSEMAQLPEWEPEFEWSFGPACRRGVLVYWVYGLAPALAALYLPGPLAGGDPALEATVCVLIVLPASALLPMALIGLSSDRETAALNLVCILRSIARTAAPYVVLWVVVLLAASVYVVAGGLILWVPTGGLIVHGGLILWLPVSLLQQSLGIGLILAGGFGVARAAALFAASYRDRLRFSL
jgi:hypothetical protein